MKKLFSFLLIGIFAVMFIGCENQGEARAIIGHSYETHNSVETDVIYFGTSGDAQVTIWKEGADMQMLSHMTYKIKGCNVEVFFDNSEYWKEAYRGELFIAFTYYPEGDYLIDQVGAIYVKVK